MLFNSLEFLFVFLPLVLVGYWQFFRQPTLRLYFINCASFVFYGFWNYKFLPLLVFSTYLDFKLAQLMSKQPLRKRKPYLVLSILTNLGLLGFFKYFYFLTDSSLWLLNLFNLGFIRPELDIILPVGISFYTFQSMSYTIDVYRSNSKPYTDYKLFTAYVCFFPQLIAGPIVRHSELVEQMRLSIRQKFNPQAFLLGLHFFSIGLAKKILLADRIAAGIDPALLQMQHLTSFESLLCALGYSLQLYYDFSGYSDMAIGLGYFFNFKFPQNFNSPYKSLSITEFWRRWHITLSRWLKDYLYISLGGNRKGTLKTYRNLMLTMLLGGLWHGAGWNYVIWGAYHGLWLVIERLLGKSLWRGPHLLKMLITFIVVTGGWMFFRSPSFNFAIEWYETLFSFHGGLGLKHFHPKVRFLFVFSFIVASLLLLTKNSNELAEVTKIRSWHILCYSLLVFLSIVFMAVESPFLYFQF